MLRDVVTRIMFYKFKSQRWGKQRQKECLLFKSIMECNCLSSRRDKTVGISASSSNRGTMMLLQRTLLLICVQRVFSELYLLLCVDQWCSINFVWTTLMTMKIYGGWQATGGLFKGHTRFSRGIITQGHFQRKRRESKEAAKRAEQQYIEDMNFITETTLVLTIFLLNQGKQPNQFIFGIQPAHDVETTSL